MCLGLPPHQEQHLHLEPQVLLLGHLGQQRRLDRHYRSVSRVLLLLAQVLALVLVPVLVLGPRREDKEGEGMPTTGRGEGEEGMGEGGEGEGERVEGEAGAAGGAEDGEGATALVT